MAQGIIEKWEEYHAGRRGTYQFRSETRYTGVLRRLFAMGLNNSHTVVDVGSGYGQFGRFLRESGFQGEYIPIDAVIDGTDLETWAPLHRADYFVCIETVEHLENPGSLVFKLLRAARFGVVITTPNSERVDVLQCDPTHVSIVTSDEFTSWGFGLERHSWFGVHEDTLLAWKHYPRG